MANISSLTPNGKPRTKRRQIAFSPCGEHDDISAAGRTAIVWRARHKTVIGMKRYFPCVDWTQEAYDTQLISILKRLATTAMADMMPSAAGRCTGKTT